jgi:hypothetical protein
MQLPLKVCLCVDSLLSTASLKPSALALGSGSKHGTGHTREAVQPKSTATELHPVCRGQSHGRRVRLNYSTDFKETELIEYSHRHHGTPNYNQDHAGSTALLMGARPKESPNVEIQHHSIEYYANQLANIERQSGVVHQDAARTYSHGRNSPHQSTGQQDSQADCNRQRADDYAVQQYQRMLLREQARRNRELERR